MRGVSVTGEEFGGRQRMEKGTGDMRGMQWSVRGGNCPDKEGSEKGNGEGGRVLRNGGHVLSPVIVSLTPCPEQNTQC